MINILNTTISNKHLFDKHLYLIYNKIYLIYEKIEMKIETLLYCIILLYYTLILHCCSKFEVSKIFFNEINTFIQ